MKFESFPKIPRLYTRVVVTEKIDGTNGQICIVHKGYEDVRVEDMDIPHILWENEDWAVWAGSRSRWVLPGKNVDNHGFAAWVLDNVEELLQLGRGRHFGEWWGKGIQRGYNRTGRTFSLFNVARWNDALGGATPPECCDVVPLLFSGELEPGTLEAVWATLLRTGSVAAQHYPYPEGMMVFHDGLQRYLKIPQDKTE